MRLVEVLEMRFCIGCVGVMTLSASSNIAIAQPRFARRIQERGGSSFLVDDGPALNEIFHTRGV